MAALQENPLFRPRLAKLARELRSLDPAFPGSKPVTRVHLLAPTSAGAQLAERYGVENGKQGAFFSLESDTDLTRIPEQLLPFCARPKLAPFLSDIPPNNSWGGSLGALLTSASIKPFADDGERKFADKCYACGTPRGGPKAPAHHPRAWWGYGEPADGTTIARQFLLALTPMCRDCTDTLQLARGYDAARKAAARTRLGQMFRYSEAEVAQYEEFVQHRADRRGSYLWSVDLSRVFANVTVHLQASWEHASDTRTSQPVLYRAGGPQAAAATLLLNGVRYEVTGSHRTHFYR